MRSIVLLFCVLVTNSLLRADELAVTEDTPQITLEFRFLTVPTPAWPKLGLKSKVLIPPPAEAEPESLERAVIEPGEELIQLISAISVTESRPPISYQILNPDQMARLIRVSESEKLMNTMQAPKITVFNGQSAQLHSTVKRPFVVELTERSKEGVVGTDATVQEFEEGAILAARPDLCEDGAIDLALRFNLEEIRDVTVSEANLGSVQVPQIRSMRIQLASRLKDGETLALWSERLTTPQEGTVTTRKWFQSHKAVGRSSCPLLLLVTARIIDVEAESIPAK